MKNLTISISLSSLSRSPLLTGTSSLSGNSFKLTNSYFSRHFSPIFYTNSNRIQFQSYKSQFKNILSAPLSFSTHQQTWNLIYDFKTSRNSFIFIAYTQFIHCENSSDLYSQYGGGIYVNYGLDIETKVKFLYVGFYNCTSKNAGAFYIYAKHFESKYICCSNCRADTIQVGALSLIHI